MDPTVAAILSILASAVATAILRWAAYRWPTDYHRKGAVKNRPNDAERD